MSRKQLLVIDDEPFILNVMKRLFGREFDVTVTTSPGEALRLLAERAWDGVICDLHLPDSDPLDFLTRVRAASGQARFVVLTAGAVTARAASVVEQLASDVLFKPFDERELRARLAA